MTDRTITQRSARYRRKLTAERNWRRVEVFVPVARVEELKAFAQQLRERPRTSPEQINDRLKLLYHRLVARQLRSNPALIDKVRAVVETPPYSRLDRIYVDEWRRLMEQPVSAISSVLTGRSAEARRLRLSSPFPYVDGLKINDEHLRRRLWRVAKKPFARSTI